MSEEELYRVYFKNLDSAITLTEFSETAGNFGNILNCKLAHDANGISKGYGFIEFDSEKAVEDFIKSVNCTLLNGKKVYICKYTTRKYREIVLQKQGSSAAANSDACLYVRNLDVDVSEEALFNHFSKIGTVISVYMCIDMDSGVSNGSAYVYFQQRADANLALDTLHLSLFCRRIITVAWFRNQKCQLGNIIIKNLHDSVDSRVLYNTFCHFGTILRHKLALDERGFSKGFGFIQFSKETEAMEAIKARHNSKMCGKKISVGKCFPRMQRQQILKTTESFTSVYVTNILENFTKKEFYTMFVKYGKIKRYMIACSDDGKCKGFGFVLFENADAARNAVSDLNGMVIESKTLHVKRAWTNNEREKELKCQFNELKMQRDSRCNGLVIHVTNIDHSLDDVGLRNLFSKFGKITSSKLVPGGHFGYVRFLHYESALEAILSMKGPQNLCYYQNAHMYNQLMQLNNCK